MKEKSGFVEDQNHKQEHFKGSAWAWQMFIIHCQSKGVGFGSIIMVL